MTVTARLNRGPSGSPASGRGRRPDRRYARPGVTPARRTTRISRPVTVSVRVRVGLRPLRGSERPESAGPGVWRVLVEEGDSVWASHWQARLSGPGSAGGGRRAWAPPSKFSPTRTPGHWAATHWQPEGIMIIGSGARGRHCGTVRRSLASEYRSESLPGMTRMRRSSESESTRRPGLAAADRTGCRRAGGLSQCQ